MPYIGRTLGQGTRSRFLYTATAGQTTFSGSDSQSNTLAYSDNNGVDCFQNGVLLKGGGADYTATTGTSVVLTTGASVNDVIEILVYDVFAIADHVKKSGDTITGQLNANGGVVFNEDSVDVDFRVESNGNANALIVDGGHSTVGINTAAVSNRTLKIEGEGNVGASVSLNESTRGGYVEYSAGSGTELYVGSELAILGSGNNNEFLIYTGVNSVKIDRSGHVTMPNQSAFMARISNPTPMTDLAINTNHTVTFNEEIFDQNADYNNSNYTFTAPVTGKYHFNCRLYLLEVPSNTTYVYFQLSTSNRDYLMHINDVDSDQYYDFLQGSLLVDMDVNDTAYVYFYQPNGSTTTHIHHQNTYFTGHLVC